MSLGPSYVVGLGACTPIGRDAWSTAAAVRAGISGFAEHPYMVDSEGEPIRGAFAPWLDLELPIAERMESLLFGAIEEALEPLTDSASPPPRMALVLGLPSPRPGLPTDIERGIQAALKRRYKALFVAMATFTQGHSAGLLALDAAQRKLGEGAYDACLIAGVDSYLDPDTLEWLEQNEQLHGAGLQNNAWGFIPGEAAGAVLLAGDRTAGSFDSLSRVLAVGTAFERNRIKTQTVCTGEGLTLAFRSALAVAPRDFKVSEIYCDMNGEPYRADEFGFATVRTAAGFANADRFHAPADCWGDVGAASGPLLVGLCGIAHRKGYADGPLGLVWTSSESGERCAALMQFARDA